MRDKDLNRHQLQAIKTIVGRLNNVQKSRRHNPGHLVDRMNIQKSINKLNDLLDRYKKEDQ